MLDVLGNVVLEFWSVLGEMAPYLLFGFLAAGALSVFVSPETIERHLGGGGLGPIIKATLFGVPLPLCSCGVIPVAASLRRHKASQGATTAFLLSTPQTGVDSIFVTLSLLGPVFAVFRALAALVSGILGGGLVSLIGSDNNDGAAEAEYGHSFVSKEEGHGRMYRMLRYGFVSLPSDIGRPMLVGLLIAGVISAFVPEDFFAGALGIGIAAKLVMMVVGIPVYVCATASVPIAAALVAKGVSPGAVLVFLMTGPATNAAAIAVVWKLLGRRTAVVYLLFIALVSLGFGTLLDGIFTAGEFSIGQGMPWMLPPVLKTVMAVLLLGVILAGMVRPYVRGSARKGQNGAASVTLAIKGMTCSHCAGTIQRSLENLEGVTGVDADVAAGSAVVRGSGLDVSLMCRIISELGYQAEPMER